MKQLVKKEFILAAHPTGFLFLGLAAMMLIPNYPLTVTFFYPCLGTFFICMTARENRDIFYTMLLPVKKRELVKARFLMCGIFQTAQVLLCIPFCFLRALYPPEGNVVGMDANFALLGFGLLLMGLFNIVFFPMHYKDPNKVGVPFLIGSVVMFLGIGIAETLPHIVPFVRDRLDTPLFAFLPEKLLCLLLGAVLYFLLTALACRKSQNSFEALDIS